MNYNFTDHFVNRHIGPRDGDILQMLSHIGVDSLESLINETVPPAIRMDAPLQLEKEITEYEYLAFLRETGKRNQPGKYYIGMGYYPVITPPAVQRHILENPGWYTQYTPYQAEISQGRLEALLNFQTMVCDLTGLPIANASLLDEGTAAAEAMLMLFNAARNSKRSAVKMLVDENVFPQTLAVLSTRALPLGIEIIQGKVTAALNPGEYFAVYVQYPGNTGQVQDWSSIIEALRINNIYTIVGADLMSLLLLTPPGEWGADVVVGSAQRFGVPMGYGGPHAAFFATRDEFKRVIPGRIIGASIDTSGKLAYRMALQTREQHIRREKATSNICTAQVLLAVTASMYALYHGPEGLTAIAQRINNLAVLLANRLQLAGVPQLNNAFFDTVRFSAPSASTLKLLKESAEQKNIHLRYLSDIEFSVSLAEPFTEADVEELVSLISGALGKGTAATAPPVGSPIPQALRRVTPFLSNQVFNRFHSETEFLRYTKRLESRDLSLTASMIPLGSCTMKLNAAAEMAGITMPEFASVHPFVPREFAGGYKDVISELECALAGVTGFAGVSLQPNSGAQGEYAGLLVIRQYHISRGDAHRNVVLIPSSAHGTNPASAVMAGMQVVVTNCDSHGNIDLADLSAKAAAHKERLAALMVTYPSTHGVFEEAIIEICEIIHAHGGQVYMDGANMNAQVGLTSPARIGADVCHLNLHKTFAIPHGGGGPGVGPICVAPHLVPFLPSHPVIPVGGSQGITAVSAAPYGSALVLLISLGYIKMLGAAGLKRATEIAILNANYIKSRLDGYYKILYSGSKNRVAHELIFDFREFKKSANIEVEDVAKRLMDYSFHAPTVSFPVPGTLMVEPTESESKEELDRFIEAMIGIRQEIAEIENGNAAQADNVLKNAPHTLEALTAENWLHPYSREKAAYPVKTLRVYKFWPSVGRVNNAHGDRNLICSCNDIHEYAELSAQVQG